MQYHSLTGCCQDVNPEMRGFSNIFIFNQANVDVVHSVCVLSFENTAFVRSDAKTA